VASSLAADLRRARHSLLRTAFLFEEAGLRIESLFLFRRSLSCPTTKGNISPQPLIPKKFQQLRFSLIHNARKPLPYQA
jgi:hypothetical protein